ncbi:urease accessory protein UreG [Ruminiclostridium hungatei]|uniref:Urease accessory protein UreG n=1 Tax=Ruminiclostridium hungatei TaxID=48256 RepID=A0A1V4SEV9_RUMHU|nr:GTP-binding protein [Ruminiclostridium hungatei]OPX42005.1 urease accessory protein UreG [Ruminiclostridium hungatei]
MKLITVAGSPSVGKTSVIVKAVEQLINEGIRIGIVKFDSLSSMDNEIYKKLGLPVLLGLSGNLCPDHYFVSNIEECFNWGKGNKLDMLITESAGLCNRCSPYIRDVLGVCVVDNLAGVNTPRKIGPMLKLADVVAITKGDIVSQAEREVFSFNVGIANPNAEIINVNGITGQGAGELAFYFKKAGEVLSVEGKKIRFTMPSAVCPYCVGETIIDRDYHRGNARKIVI